VLGAVVRPAQVAQRGRLTVARAQLPVNLESLLVVGGRHFEGPQCLVHETEPIQRFGLPVANPGVLADVERLPVAGDRLV
jgi:hypothetical protein